MVGISWFSEMNLVLLTGFMVSMCGNPKLDVTSFHVYIDFIEVNI